MKKTLCKLALLGGLSAGTLGCTAEQVAGKVIFDTGVEYAHQTARNHAPKRQTNVNAYNQGNQIQGNLYPRGFYLFQDDGDGVLSQNDLKNAKTNFKQGEEICFYLKHPSNGVCIFDTRDSRNKRVGKWVTQKRSGIVIGRDSNNLSPGNYQVIVYLAGSKVATKNFSVSE